MAQSSTFDSKRGVFYAMYQHDEVSTRLLGINVADGSTVDVDFGKNALYTVDYSPSLDQLVGIGLAFNAATQFRTIQTLDAANPNRSTVLMVRSLPLTLAFWLLLAISPARCCFQNARRTSPPTR